MKKIILITILLFSYIVAEDYPTNTITTNTQSSLLTNALPYIEYRASAGFIRKAENYKSKGREYDLSKVYKFYINNKKLPLYLVKSNIMLSSDIKAKKIMRRAQARLSLGGLVIGIGFSAAISGLMGMVYAGYLEIVEDIPSERLYNQSIIFGLSGIGLAGLGCLPYYKGKNIRIKAVDQYNSTLPKKELILLPSIGKHNGLALGYTF